MIIGSGLFSFNMMSGRAPRKYCSSPTSSGNPDFAIYNLQFALAYMAGRVK